MRLGIYGGTFSPPHKGHIEAAEAFYREMKLDKLMIIPTFIPPHKSLVEEATPDERLDMCRLAFSHIPNTEISDIEIKRGGKSYTYLTLEELSGDGIELFFLCGTDMILTFDLWRRYEYIFSLATVCYVRRESDFENDAKIDEKTRQYRKVGAKIVEIKHQVTEISSTDIRNHLFDGSADNFLTEGVLNYIRVRGLYCSNWSDDEISLLRDKIRALLTERRFLHTLGVERAAVKIAERVAPELVSRARVAAILHDVTKEMAQDALIREYGIELDSDDLRSPETLHALTAPPYIAEHFPRFAADDILFAVKTHTTGETDMSLLGKIIFVADYIEEGRKYESSSVLRNHLYSELDAAKTADDALMALDKAVVESINYTLAHLESTNKFSHPKTRLTRDFIINSHK